MRILLAAVLSVFSPLVLAAGEPAQDSQQAEIAKLVKQLSDDAFARREAAVKRLTEIGRPAIPALERAAQGASLEARMRARHVLREIDPAMRNFAALSSPDLPARTAALRSLAGYRRAVLVPKLVELLEDAPAHPRTGDERDYVRALLAIAGYQQDQRATPALGRLLLASDNTYTDPDEEIVTAMAQIADPGAADVLLKYVETRNDRTADSRLNAALADALGGTRDARCVAPILDLLDEPYDGVGGAFVQQAATRGLTNIGAAAVGPLAREYPRRRDYAQVSIAMVLGKIGGDDATQALATVLKHDTSYEAAVALDRLGDPRGAAHIRDELERLKEKAPFPGELYQALEKCRGASLHNVCRRLLDSDEFSVRLAAAQSLARQGDDAGVQYLRNLLESKTHASFAIRALASVGDDASTQDFARLAHDWDQGVVQFSIYGLAELHNREAAQALMKMAQGPRTVRGHAELRRDSVRALTAYPSREVIDLLVKLLGDDDKKVAGAAAMALSEIAGAEFVDQQHRRQWWAYHRSDYPPLATLAEEANEAGR